MAQSLERPNLEVEARDCGKPDSGPILPTSYPGFGFAVSALPYRISIILCVFNVLQF